MRSMDFYSKAAMERAMKIQEVLWRAMARKITWFQAAEILGFTDRHWRRIRERYQEFGYDGLLDRRSELGVQMIPADSPQARGRSERNFGTWPGRLPQELRLHGIPTLEAAHYIAQFNRRFQVPAREPGSAFVRRSRRDLDLIFALPYQRTVNRDNTVSVQNLQLQIEPVRWRATLAGGTVTVHQHLDGTFTLTHGPQRLGHYSADGVSLDKAKIGARGAVEKTQAGKVKTPTFPSLLGNPQNPRDSHFPTASAAAGLT